MQGGSASRLGISIWRGLHSHGWADRLNPLSDTTGYGQRVRGTNPTGIHSCLFYFKNTRYSLGERSTANLFQ